MTLPLRRNRVPRYVLSATQRAAVDAAARSLPTSRRHSFLLRVASAPTADVEYDSNFGGKPVRLYPTPDSRIVIPEYADFMKFQHSLVLRTWFGCKGNIPQKPGKEPAACLII